VPKEQDLIDQILAGDDAIRAVYADWLEQQGHVERAEMLRLQEQIARIPDEGRGRREAGLARLRELAVASDIEWRMAIARSRVLSCARPDEPRCSMDWGQLQATPQLNIRNCNKCDKPVRYVCTDVEYEYYSDRCPLVVDVALRHVSRQTLRAGEARGPDGSCPRCTRKNQPHYRFCIECGIDMTPTADPAPLIMVQHKLGVKRTCAVCGNVVTTIAGARSVRCPTCNTRLPE
jgi:uncharacterized protein (TIGR02996 family)